MSSKSYTTATFATVLVAVVLGCDDSVSPPSGPISITGVYDYAFLVSNDEEGEDEVSCAGEGVIDVTQDSDSTFTALTAATGIVACSIFGQEETGASGEVQLAGQIDGRDVTLQFPLLEDTELCDAEGEVVGGDDPVTALEGTATCTIDPAVFGLPGDPVTITGTWQADRTGG